MQNSPKVAKRSSLGRFNENNPAFRVLWLARYWVISGSVALALIAYALTSLLPTQYMGSTIIQIGSIRIGDIKDALQQQSIEQPSVAAARFSSVPFKTEILKAAGLPVGERDPDSNLAMDSFFATNRPTSSIVEVQVVATSPERVVQILNAAASTLTKAHEALAEPRLQVLRDQIKSVLAEMDDLDKDEDGQAASSQAQSGAPNGALGYAVAARLLFSLQEKSRLKTLERNLKERLALSEPTRAVTAPSVLARPVGPRRSLYASVAMIVTFVLLVTLILLLAPSNAPRDWRP